MYRADHEAAPFAAACASPRVTQRAFRSGLSHVAMLAAMLGGAFAAATPASAHAGSSATEAARPVGMAAWGGAERADRRPAARLRFAQAAARDSSSDAETLPTVEVAGERRPGELPPAYPGGQVATGGSLGVLGTRDVINTPFSTQNFTEKLIEDQQARTAADTLLSDSSVRTTTAANGFSDDFQIRGFAVGAADVGFNGLYGLISSNRAPAQVIERIQLLKGPGAFAFGIPPGGSVGGSINILTKRASEDTFVRLTPQFVGAGNYGLLLDASTRAGENKEWGIRVNGVGRNGEGTIDNGNFRTGLGAISLDYRGDRLRWAVDAISQNDDTRNFRPQITLRPGLTTVPRPPDARGNWYPGTQLSQRDNTIASFLEYDLTDWLTIYGGIGYRRGTNEQTFPDSRVAGFTSGVDALGNFRLSNSFYDSYTETVSGNVGLRARFDTGFINHSLNLVFTGFEQEGGFYFTSNPTSRSVASNIYRPVPIPSVINARLAPLKNSDLTLKSFAAVDTMSFFNDTVLLTAGVRHQMVNNQAFTNTTGVRTSVYDSEVTSPLAGIVVKPWQNVSVYANYAEGLSQGQIVGAGFANTGSILAPYVSDQQEVGIKVDWGRITTTAALFQISRPTIVTTAANNLAYDGETRNQGLELSAFGEILPGLRALGGVTFLRPELTKPTIASQRGNDAPGVPDTSVSAGLDWDAPWVPGLAFNGRVIYTSGLYLNTANTLRLPDWTRVDLGVRYTTAVNNKPVTFRLNVENALDNRFWLTNVGGTFLTVGAPRTFVASAQFDF